MNRSMVRYLLSKLLLIEAALLLVPMLVAIIYSEPLRVLNSIGITIGILLILGLLGSAFKPKNYHIYTKRRVIDCRSLLDTLVFLRSTAFCLIWANSKHHRCLL